jgi:predicted Zn-dependent protease
MRAMPRTHLPAVAALACLLSACTLTRPAPFSSPSPPAAPSPSGSGQPAPGTPAPGSQATPVTPEKPPGPAPRQFHLGTASAALVAQAHTQAAGGDYGRAAATLERALRIEPDNPLLWTELGRVRLGESNPAQAVSVGQKALSLATGDPAAQASAWHLIADSLKAQGRNGEAAEAERRATGAALHQG